MSAKQNVKRCEHRKALLKQRLAGVFMLVISALTVMIALTGTDVIEKDITSVFFTVPVGLALLFINEPM